MGEGKFREDLFYRLNVIPIHIPPLRERKDDIFTLIHYFIAKNGKKYNEEKRLSVELLSRLITYRWPGNIRELENLVERLYVTSTGDVLGLEDLPLEYHNLMEQNDLDACGIDPSGAAVIGRRPPNNHTAITQKTLKEYMDEAERHIIRERYEKLQSSYKVAKDLGISQSQAYQKIKKYVSDN